MTDETRLRIDRARRAELAFEEFIGPTVDAVTEAYTERMRQIVSKEPWEVEKIKALVTAQRVAEAVGAHMKAVLDDGTLAKKDLDRIENVASMSTARRRALGY